MINKNIQLLENYFKDSDDKFLYYIEEDKIFITNPINTTFKIPVKKEIGIKWIENKINKDSFFKNLSDAINNLNIVGGLVYGASYGIGVLCLNGLKNLSDVEINKIKSFLDINNISYKWEYSNKFFVYRFRISKSENNLKKLGLLK